jgi:hypothetical protein
MYKCKQCKFTPLVIGVKYDSNNVLCYKFTPLVIGVKCHSK